MNTKRTRNNLILAVSALVMCIAVAATTVFAWFAPILKENQFAIKSGETDVQVKVYAGTDDNRDGILDPNVDGLSRGEKISAAYKVLNEFNGVDGMLAGDKLVYKLVILNPDTAVAKAAVSVNFSALSYYLFDSAVMTRYRDTGTLVPDGEVNYNSVFNGCAARFIFAMSSVAARIYVGGGDFDRGYDTLAQSSVEKEVTETVSRITKLKGDAKLWEISEGQKFIDSVMLAPGELMEFDFLLEHMQLLPAVSSEYIHYVTGNADYIAQCNAVFGNDASSLRYLEAVTEAELEYFLSDGAEEAHDPAVTFVPKNNYFTINKIIITAVQSEGGGV